MSKNKTNFEDNRRIKASVVFRFGSRSWMGEPLIGASYTRGDSCSSHAFSLWFLIGSLHLTWWWKRK